MSTTVESLRQSVRYKVHDLNILDFVWSNTEIDAYIVEAVKKLAQYKYVNINGYAYSLITNDTIISPTVLLGDQALITDITKILVLAHTGINFKTEDISLSEGVKPRDDEEFIVYLIDMARGQAYGLIGYFTEDDSGDITIDFGS